MYPHAYSYPDDCERIDATAVTAHAGTRERNVVTNDQQRNYFTHPWSTRPAEDHTANIRPYAQLNPMHSDQPEPKSAHTGHAQPGPDLDLSPAVLAAIARALNHVPADSSAQAVQPLLPRKFFSNPITNHTSDLPIAVIKELKGGFKNYIPLSMCTHKACSHATRTPETVDTEIGWTDKGEMRVKQKLTGSVGDYTLSTDDFTEIRENFIRGMRKHLVMEEEGQANECTNMFAEYFRAIAARFDYTQDWPSYRGFMIESYSAWVGRSDDSYGLIFSEKFFYQYKVSHIVPTIMEQLKQPSSAAPSSSTGRGGGFYRGRGRFPQATGFFRSNRGGYHGQSSGTSSHGNFKCYLCGSSHSHWEHQGAATRLATNDQGKWIDKSIRN